ncbi:hypothetical protein HNY73_000742 [Argiope bruennichi]|uniref:Uncharacterized protein n=1 Tax=Argiope bruennichi TaxID=94029 RepID=A0A8T0G3D0_ARGBR|nr:hypothetical protein HNY73_000742 [Argiope bruennichi]
MSNNKFFIGLGATVPSTRVLKPPGGDCSDLFGLKTRQQSLIKSLKGTSSVIDYLLNQQQSKDRHLYKPEHRNTSLSSVTSMDMSQVTPNSTLSSPNNRSKPLNNIHTPTKSVSGMSVLTETHKSYSAKEPSKVDMNLVGDNFNGLNIKDSIKSDSKSNEEIRQSSRQNNELSSLVDKSYNKAIKASNMALNSNVTTKTTNNSSNSRKTFADSEMNTKKEREKKFIRNPITGALTEVKSWNKSNPVISRMSSVQEIKSKACRSEMISHSKVIADDSLKVKSRVFAKRNPITGEGIPINPYLSGTSHSRIRVIHPPGGISSGIY